MPAWELDGPIWTGPLDLLDLTLDSPEQNLALDERLLGEVDRNERAPLLRLWELQSHAVVLGRSGKIEIDVHQDACRERNIPVLKRCSGGGTVVLGPGCLVYSFFLPVDRQRMSIRDGIAHVLCIVEDAIRECGIESGQAGTSDLATMDYKFSGNSQKWSRNAVLHHGTILYDADLELISRLLKQPERQPDYRRDRQHRDFIQNLPVDGAELRRQLIAKCGEGEH
ncbi:MAG: lipoate--protein ligase family protein [Planctomycetota bacterium]|nr:lipoate--protein ligase family protein [Planctomycetota bacterium]